VAISLTLVPSAPDPEKDTGQKAVNGTATSEASKQATASYVVPTITCPSCNARVEASASKDPGVLDVRFDGQNVTITYDPEKTDPGKIAEAIREGGDTVQRGTE
jgi:copper chaperone CopZ